MRRENKGAVGEMISERGLSFFFSRKGSKLTLGNKLQRAIRASSDRAGRKACSVSYDLTWL